MNNRHKLLVAFGVIVFGACIWFGKPLWQTQSSAGVAVTAGMAQPTVILYGTDWCPYCAHTRNFFAVNGIQYADLDIEKSAAAGQQYKEFRGTGVPVIVVGDRVIRGYDEASLRDALGPWLKGRDLPRDAPDVRVQLQAREFSARLAGARTAGPLAPAAIRRWPEWGVRRIMPA